MTSETAINKDAMGDTAHNPTGGHAKPRYDDVNVPVVVLIGIISAVVTFLTIAFVQGLYGRWADAFVDNTPNPVIAETIDLQKSMLTANPETRRLSIEKSMDLIATEFAQPGKVDEAANSHAGSTHDADSATHGSANSGTDDNEDNHAEDGKSNNSETNNSESGKKN